MKQLIILFSIFCLSSAIYAGCGACGSNHNHDHNHSHDAVVEKSCGCASADSKACDKKKSKSACSPCGSDKKTSECAK